MTVTSKKKYYWTESCKPVASYIDVNGNHYPRVIDIEWMGAHDYGLLLSMDYPNWVPGSPVTANFDAMAGAMINECIEHNVEIMLELNDIFYWLGAPMSGDPNLSSRTVTMNMPGSYWIDKYGALFAALEDRYGPSGSEAQILKGYWCEACFDNGAAGLREMTDLEIWLGISHRTWRDAGTTSVVSFIGNGHESREDAMNRRMGLVDGVDIELWCYDDITEGPYPAYCLPDCAAWIQNNHPNIPIGLNSIRRYGPLAPDPPMYPATSPIVMWSISEVGDAIPAPFTVQQARFAEAANTVKKRIGKFDRLSIQTGGGNETIPLYDNDAWTAVQPYAYKTDPTWWEFQLQDIAFWEMLDFMNTSAAKVDSIVTADTQMQSITKTIGWDDT